MTDKMQVLRRAVGEWSLHSGQPYENPFTDVVLKGVFTAPSGREYVMPGFYDGDGTWRVRFSPAEVGAWRWRTRSRPADADLTQEGVLQVEEREARGFLQATPAKVWGLCYESGEPAFLLGDTVYNLFGMAYCWGDVEGFLRRRAKQGFNAFRVRLPVSPFHPPDGYSEWQSKRTWPWGGSEQSPRFDRFNLDYFQAVDQVVRLAASLDVGFEMIMEAWGFEFPFNCRHIFVPEWEALWLRYLIARYDAYSSVYFWTLMNEYEYYPDGNWHYNPVADRWAMRVGRWVQELAPHGHIVSVHNGPTRPPFARRFAADPGAIGAVMLQTWGTTGEKDGWLAAGIEDEILHSLQDWPGAAVFAEYGYERNPELPLVFPGFKYCDSSHNRRGAWRGAFCGLSVFNGFENTWGPFMKLDQDQEGVAYLKNVKKFFTQVVPFERLRVAHDLVLPGEYARGHKPLVLASPRRDLVAAYLPAGGEVGLDLPGSDRYGLRWWYDPRVGDLHDVTESQITDGKRGGVIFTSPGGEDKKSRPLDWVLVLVANDEEQA